jgi:hypothetical protein
MNYLYHWVPENMEGEVLYPLNILKEINLNLFNSQVSKYKGREKVMNQFIPTLECLWNDVLHLSAIHPKDVKNALIEAGSEKNIKMKCYQVDSNLLEIEKTTIYFSGDIPSERMKMKNFTNYNPLELNNHSRVPQETKDYYKKMIKLGKSPLIFHKAPHILYKGTINIKNCDVIEV